MSLGDSSYVPVLPVLRVWQSIHGSDVIAKLLRNRLGSSHVGAPDAGPRDANMFVDVRRDWLEQVRGHGFRPPKLGDHFVRAR